MQLRKIGPRSSIEPAGQGCADHLSRSALQRGFAEQLELLIIVVVDYRSLILVAKK